MSQSLTGILTLWQMNTGYNTGKIVYVDFEGESAKIIHDEQYEGNMVAYKKVYESFDSKT